MNMQASQLVLNIVNKNELFIAYMPFIKNGGLFIAAKQPFQLGEKVTFTLNLWCLTSPVIITGTVAWITPLQAQGERPAGIGVQFMQECAKEIKKTIEKQLAEFLPSEQLSNTL